MTCNLITTTLDASAAQAAALMLEHRIGSLPVLADGALVGVVTDRDAVKTLACDVPAVDRMINALG